MSSLLRTRVRFSPPPIKIKASVLRLKPFVFWRDINKPTGISQHEAKIIKLFPDKLKRSLASLEQIEQELGARE